MLAMATGSALSPPWPPRLRCASALPTVPSAEHARVPEQVCRSWLPPGTTCTYDLSGYGLPTNVVIGAPPLRLAASYQR